jgi:hypothetical protein
MHSSGISEDNTNASWLFGGIVPNRAYLTAKPFCTGHSLALVLKLQAAGDGFFIRGASKGIRLKKPGV